MEEIKNYENYLIDVNGDIWSYHKNRLLKPSICYYGYKNVCLIKRGVKKSFKVHRLIAINFIPNPENKPCVNHIDGNKINNSISNLEWCTHKENSRHAWDNGLVFHSNAARMNTSKRMKLMTGENHIGAIKVLDTKTGKIYGMISEASISLGISAPHLSRMLNGKRNNSTNLIYLNK